MIDGIKGPAGDKGPRGPIGHRDEPGLPGVNGVDGIDNCEDKYEKGHSLRNHGIKGTVGHVGPPSSCIVCSPKGPTGNPGLTGRSKTEESPVLRSYNLAVKTGGFQGSFEEYGKMMEGRPKGPTGLSAGPGLVGHSRSSTSIMDDTSFLKLDKKEKLNHMYERAKSEGWYKGTLDDFRKFEDRSHWIPYGKFNKDINIHLDESQLQRKKESYELALKLFYHGTLEDFLLFTTNYCWGPVRKDTYID